MTRLIDADALLEEKKFVTRVREMFAYDANLGVLVRMVSGRGKGKGSVAGGAHGNGYISVKLDGKKYYAHRLIWLHVYGEFPDGFLDHINGIRDDNRIENLRIASPSENMKNARIGIRNTTLHKGVSFHKATGKYRAQAMLNNKLHHLGSFLTDIEASDAYNNFCRENHGNFYLDTRKLTR